MKAAPTQQRALLKRTALIKAAEELFSTLGYEATTAKRIASHAEVATGTFYQNFDNKDDILREIAQGMRETVYQAIPEQITTSDNISASELQHLIHQVLEIIYNYHQQNPDLHKVLDQRRNMDPTLDQILQHCEQKMESKIRLFLDKFELQQADIVAYNLYAMAEGLVHRHVFGPERSDKTQILDLAASMLASYLQQYIK